MNFSWPKEGVSVILLPPKELGEKVFELAQEWTQHKLLSPAIYISVEEQSTEIARSMAATGPTQIAAKVVGRNGFKPVSLFDELSRNSVSIMRVLACRSVQKDENFHEIQDQIVDRLQEQVKVSAPTERLLDGAKLGTKLILINFISGPAMRNGGSTEHLIEKDWTANIVLSPEDRAEPLGFDSFVNETDIKYPGFILANIASAVGLWTGVNKSIVELSDVEPSTVYDKVMVQRTFARAVITEGVAIRIAAHALRQIEIFGNPVADPTYVLKEKTAMTEDEAKVVVRAAVEAAMDADSKALRFELRTEKPAEEDKAIRFMEGLKMFAEFFVNKIKAFPFTIIDAVTMKFNEKATNVLFGKESGYRIESKKDLERYGITKRDNEEILKIGEVRKSVGDYLQKMLVAPEYRSNHPRLWYEIRRNVFELLDGTNERAKGKIVADSELLIPKYGDVWTIPDFALDPDEKPEEIKSTLEWLDVDLALKISGQLDTEISQLQVEVEGYKVELLEAETEKAKAKSEIRGVRNEREKLIDREVALRMILEEIDGPKNTITSNQVVN